MILFIGVLDGDQFDDGFDSDLMGDEEDRAQLEEMTEAQREKILYERTERREAMKKRWEIEKVTSDFSILYFLF